MQAIDVSDIHSVASHDVGPPRNLAVCHWLKLEPIIVRLNEPVDPAFIVRFPCSDSTEPSTVQICVMLPDDPSPAVTASLLLPAGEDFPALHLKIVSDSQRVLSQSEWPSLLLTLEATDPNRDPITVTLDDPLPTLFMHSTVLLKLVEVSPKKTSALQPAVKLPDLSPAVIVTRRVPRIPTPTMHLTAVSDSHPVASHPVNPARRPVV